MDYLEVLDNLKDYYSNLLIVQYNNKPKATATIKMLVELIYTKMILMQIRDGFDWKTAKEAQLDIIGNWVGVSKFYDGKEFFNDAWFSLIDDDKTPNSYQTGYADYKGFIPFGRGFLSYNSTKSANNKLIPEYYIQIIGLKIIYNNINHTAGAIDEAIWNYFNEQVYTLWEHHKIVYCYNDKKYGDILRIAKLKNILPCPIGCSIELREITK